MSTLSSITSAPKNALTSALNKSTSKTSTNYSSSNLNQSSGYEVIRNGRGYSVVETKQGDIVLKTLPKRTSTSGSSSRGSSDSNIISNPSSPTGYSDTLNQPVSIMPSINSNNLKSQFESSVQPVNERTGYGYVKEYKQPVTSSIKEGISNLWSNIKSRSWDKSVFGPLSKADLPSIGLRKESVTDYLITPSSGFNPIGIVSSKNKPERIYEINIEKGKEIDILQTGISTKSSDYATSLSSSSQGEYNKEFNIAQSNIDTGSWSLQQGKDYLKFAEGSIESKYKTNLESYNKELSKQFTTSVGSIESKYNPKIDIIKYTSIDTGKALAKGIPIGLEIGALSVLGSGAIGGIGKETGLSLGKVVTAGFFAKEVILGGKEQDLPRVVFGAGGLGFTSLSTARLMASEISASEDIGGLSRTKIDFPELRFQGETSDFSIIKGVREYGGLKQEITVSGSILKNNEFFMQPNSAFVSKIEGTIPSAWGGGLFGVKPQAFKSLQVGAIGSKGLSLPISENAFATFGKGNIVTKFETYGVTNLNKIKQPNIISYHGTTDIYKADILDKGLISGSKSGVSQRFSGLKLEEVYTTPSKKWATSWSNMAVYGKGTKTGSPQVFEVVMPKNVFESSLIKRGIEKGGAEEFTFKSISPKYIKGSSSFNPVQYSYSPDKLITSFRSNAKFVNDRVSTNYFAGISKQIGNDLYLSKSGKITNIQTNPSVDIGGLKIVREGTKIDASLKDWTLTKIIPKSSVKGSTTVDFTNTKSGLGLTQIPKQSFQGSSLVSSSAIQEFKQNLVPKLMPSNSFTSKGFAVSGRGLISTQTTKNKNIYSSGLSSSSLDLSSSNFRVSSSSLSSLSSATTTSFKQPSAQSSALSSIQSSKLDLGLKQITPQELSFNNLSPSGFGGFGGFGGWGLPAFSLPSFGGGLGYVKPKTRGKRKKTKIKPSLTASLFDIRGSLPKGGAFGISPFQLRKIPKGSRNPYATSF